MHTIFKFRLLMISSFFVVSMLYISCKNERYQLTSGGLKYRFIEQKNGRKPKPGDLMRMHLNYLNSRDSILYDSDELGDAFVLQLTPPTFSGGLEEGFSMMGEGDSAIFLVPADSVFIKTFNQSLPPHIKKGEWLHFRVRMIKVMSPDEFNEELSADKNKTSQKEISRIEEYLKLNNIAAAPVREGIYFVIFQEGDGPKPFPGDSVEIEYNGCFLSGEVFDASDKKGQSLKYQLGDGSRLEAWEMAVSSMKEGSVARLVLASEKAFGKSGDGPVPPDTPVIFNIKLLKVKAKRTT